MEKIYKYRKITDAVTTYQLIEPDYNLVKTPDRVKELATISGWTYVSVPDSLVLPKQPPQVVLYDAESPEKVQIDEQVVEKIRQKYSINDELKVLRLAVEGQLTEYTQYNTYVKECSTWGQAEKAKLAEQQFVK